MELVTLSALTDQDWAELEDGEPEPFGPVGAGLAWRPKDRHIGLRAPDGRLVAVAGAVIATIEVEGAEPFEVVGLGSMIVTRSQRGRGLMSRLVEPVLALAGGMGPDRAMIFCRPELVGLYRRLAFAEITAQVWADQPDGRVEMPEPAMWRALRQDAEWPQGRADVRGLPF
ncbi:MAG TPA: GNAT family N-acetyltransferase [Solirubrobacteraceae bacterium]|nr:GNAT family N-acetyltransferase [Solirubrobacteraceae bacterium]